MTGHEKREGKKGVSRRSANTALYLEMSLVLARSGLISVHSDLGLALNWSADNCFQERECLPRFVPVDKAGWHFCFFPGQLQTRHQQKCQLRGTRLEVPWVLGNPTL